MEQLTSVEEMIMKCIWNYGKEMPFLQLGKELKEKYEIKGYPTMLIFKNGEEVKRILGYREESEILKEIR